MSGNLIHAEPMVIYAGLATFVALQVVISIREVFYSHSPIWRLSMGGRQWTSDGLIPDYLQSNIFPGLLRGTGTLGHPLPMAFFFVVAFAFTLAFSDQLDWRVRWIVCGLAIGGCLLAGARSALVAVAVVFVIAVYRRSVVASVFTAVVLYLGYQLIGSQKLHEALGIDSLLASGSYTHRSRVIASLPALFDQPLLRLLFGSGYKAEGKVITAILGGRFSAVDNQFVTTMIASGLIGLLLFVAWLVRSAWVNHGQLLLPIVGIVVMFMSFDAMSWHATLALTVVVLGISGQELVGGGNRVPSKGANH
ncbi:hypothetical protein [Gordonia sp. i37]|uniref:hypothetical protein n=1 Tax=Gordonia sp. i37 TaxID=1961707 RepID=UPI00111A98BF|nr:hypothetical protein [Gordonia sp. i37]